MSKERRESQRVVKYSFQMRTPDLSVVTAAFPMPFIIHDNNF